MSAVLFADVDDGLVARFMEYHQANPSVFRQFVRLAHDMRAAGRRRYSQWTIVQAIRWSHDLQGSASFKINNDFIALYARLMIHDYPAFAGFFELREMKGTGRRVSLEESRRNAERRAVSR